MKLADKALLLLAIPLCLVVIFLWMLMRSVEEAQLDTAKEALQGKALVYVNLVVYDAMDAGVQFFLYRALRENRFATEFNETFSKLEEHRSALREIASRDTGEHGELTAFVKMVDDFDEMFMQAKEIIASGNGWGNVRTVANLRNYMKRVSLAGNTIVEKTMKEREQLLELHNLESHKMLDAIKIFAVLLVLIVVALALALNLTFQRTLNVLVENAQFIAMGKPLVKPLQGSGELVQLDKTIHYLSSALAQARSDERALIDYAAEIICSLDQQLRVTQVNPAVMKVLGVSDQDFLGTAIQSWVVDEDRDSTFASLEECKTKSAPAIFEARMKNAAGAAIDTAWNARWSDEKRSFFCIVHDISARKEAELLKQQVLTMVSHDLRSPLASVSVTLELLKEGVFGQLNDKGSSVVDKAQASISTLVNMINDLLEIERFEFGGGTLNLVRMPVRACAMQAIDMIASQAEKKGIEIECHCGSFETLFDPDRIQRVFVNLLGNSLKFAPEKSEIRISAELRQDETPGNAPWIEVRIQDQGPGIPIEKQALIFEKFKQSGRNDEAERSGSGLGLAICKAIVEAHGGTIGVDSTIGEGSAFWFRLRQQ